MPWKTMEVREQRVRFVVAAARKEQPFLQLCQEFGISRPTGYAWLERYRQSGLEGIQERSRRPQRIPRQTAGALERLVVQQRLRYPDWGARKLQVLLCREGVQLTRSTIHRILLRYDLVRDEDRPSEALRRFERQSPNELWQMDFKGPKGWPGSVGPLSLLDDHSRFVPLLKALNSTLREPVQQQLEQTFCECGLPDAILMDHGVPWWSARSPSGFTRLSVWLMKQGIELLWSGIRHPQTQGKVERFHGELQRALDRRGLGRDAQAWLEAFRWEHNHLRPHEALGMRTPAQLWRPSPRPFDPRPPDWHYPPEANVLKVDSQGKVDAWGQRWLIGQALCGERIGLLRLGDTAHVYFCATLIRELDFVKQRSLLIDRWLPDLVSNPKL
jgi:transposase InsO family protein